MPRSRIAAGAAAALLLAAICGPAHITAAQAQAQEQTTAPAAPPPGIADQEPYRRWTAHTGTAAEAVVHVRVRIKEAGSDTVRVRAGSGFVVRCDGFVMVPSRLLARTTGGVVGETTLTFADADGPLPAPQIVPFPRFFRADRDYAVIKVNGFHLKGLPLLHPENIREGMPVRIVYARPREGKPGEAEAVTRTAEVGTPQERGGTRYALRFEPGTAQEAPPPGAVVVEADSGLAVGIVPYAEPPAARFTTFAELHSISNAVGLLPEPSATKPGGERDEAMVWVPGGPVELTGQLWKDNRALYGGPAVACTPGFSIDRYAVTNEEYREFLIATRYPRLPAGWDRAELTQPRLRQDFPVSGVTVTDAAAYARWRGKRLPTPVEWLRATQGAGGDWLAPYLQTWKGVRERYADLARTRDVQVELARQALLLPGTGGRGAAVDLSPYQNAISSIDNEAATTAEALIAEFGSYPGPWQVAPVGWRRRDASLYGVRDVAMNPPEILQNNAMQRPAEVGGKLSPATPDPAADGLTGAFLSGRVGGMSLLERWCAPPARLPAGYGFRCAR